MRAASSSHPTQACSSAVRRFFSHTLDACGPAGVDFLSVLGAHEGEGLVWDRGAEVAASSGRSVLGGRGQLARAFWLRGGVFPRAPLLRVPDSTVLRLCRVSEVKITRLTKHTTSFFCPSSPEQIDLQIVDVAALYQDELRRSYDAATGGGGAGAGDPAAAAAAGPRVVPVLLLSSDNGQIQQARSHGVPAVRIGDAADALVALVDGRAPLTASRLREALAGVATAGANDRGGMAASLQREFDQAVACLRLATEALASGTGAWGRRCTAFVPLSLLSFVGYFEHSGRGCGSHGG